MFKLSDKVQSEKRRKGLCLTPFCSRAAAPGKHYCHRCRKRSWYQANPISYKYSVLKNNARRRGIEFALTFEQFESFCMDIRYHELSGKKRNSYSIDRIDVRRGYVIDNLQVLTISENSTKWNNEDKILKHEIAPF
jgi:hypothetical protein